MAIAKKARVIFTEKWNEGVCHIRCELVEPRELGFIGGQYVIVNSGIQLPGGRMGKRAYSIASADSDQTHFELVVRRIPGGVGSRFIHEARIGQEFEFSGPWGKFLPPEEPLTSPGADRPRRLVQAPVGQAADGRSVSRHRAVGTAATRHSTEPRILVVATDTGLTAALGLLRGKQFAPFLPQTQLLWLVESESYFIPLTILREWIPAGFRGWSLHTVPPVGQEERVRFCVESTKVTVTKGDSHLRGSKERWGRVYLSGDGHVIQSLEEEFVSRGYSGDEILKEPFFNLEERKAPSAQKVSPPSMGGPATKIGGSAERCGGD